MVRRSLQVQKMRIDRMVEGLNRTEQRKRKQHESDEFQKAIARKKKLLA